MGCASSTAYHTDPHTGQESKKKRLGGAYPGQRRPQHQPYTPPEEAFAGGNNTATQHFVAHGGGNALTLANPDGSAIPPASGGPAKEYIQVTLPDGVKAGDTIHVQSPSGKTNAIVIPSGFGPGSTFTVEFANETSASKPGASYGNNNDDDKNNYQQYNNSSNNNGNGMNPPPDQGPDDGFATGFNNPHWQPSATAVQEPEVHVSSYSSSGDGHYPSATATPVYTPQYSSPPSYPSGR
uniref:Uncharacterized protein n=1 Tax=Amphora coffeiformis TaxID=265554 RepID=A0A7S3KZZ8_9STRA